MTGEGAALKDVTVGIKSFFRKEQLTGCLEGLVGLPFAEVIVADDGEIGDGKRSLYKTNEGRLPLRLLELEFDTGLSFGRNEIVRACQTEYLLMLDDDQVVPRNVGTLREILVADKSLGGVSGYWMEDGRLRCSACNLFETDRHVIKDIGFGYRREHVGRLGYYVFEFIPNSTLFRIECLRQIGWDDHYKIAKEHVDFYLAHKRAGRWRFAVTPEVVIGHFPATTDLGYIKNFRKNAERIGRSNEHFRRKWGKLDVIEGLKLVEEEFSLRRHLTHWALAVSPAAAELVNGKPSGFPSVRRFDG
jgi:glycosyltransferase involved in cell wall biosynthesis